jgi:hypothetical protein
MVQAMEFLSSVVLVRDLLSSFGWLALLLLSLMVLLLSLL